MLPPPFKQLLHVSIFTHVSEVDTVCFPLKGYFWLPSGQFFKATVQGLVVSFLEIPATVFELEKIPFILCGLQVRQHRIRALTEMVSTAEAAGTTWRLTQLLTNYGLDFFPLASGLLHYSDN